MAFDVNAFKQNIAKYGTLQTNKFEVSIPLNLNLAAATGMSLADMSSLISFRADKASLPKAEFLIIDNPIFGYGPIQKMPTNMVFEDIQISFIADADGEIYNFLYGWMNYIYNFVGVNNNAPSYQVAYKDDYCATVSIITYDQNGNAVTTHNLFKAYPTAIGAVPLDWGDNNNLMKIDMSLTYFTWSMTKNSTTTTSR